MRERAPTYTLVVYPCRSVEDHAIAGGFVVNELLNYGLKKSFRRPRPDTCHNLDACDSYGYPSSHAQCMWYFITVGCLMRWRAFARSQNDSTAERSAFWALAAPASLLAGLCVPASRVVLGYHTTEQVLVGSLVGVLSGLAWYLVLTCSEVQQLFDRLEEFPGLDQCLCKRRINGNWTSGNSIVKDD
jgi:dolichyldiphosphatase